MKKDSLVIEEKNVYNLEVLIKNTALMKSVTGKSGLINIKSNEIVGSFDNFYTIYSSDNYFYFQEKEVEDESKDYFKRKKYVRIYDALNEKTIADNWLVIDWWCNYYDLTILQDPCTQKYHLFHGDKYRTALNIFENEFDEVKYLYDYYGDRYFSVSKNGKKAIYSSRKGLITSYEYDDIERIGFATVFTQENHKFFTWNNLSGNKVKSPLFDDIRCDIHNSSIIYCQRNLMIAIYFVDEFNCRLLFTIPTCDDIECVDKIEDPDYIYSILGSEYIFLVKRNNKYGLSSGVVNRDDENEVPCQSLTNIEYDGIEYKDGNYFLEKDGKKGLFTGIAKNKRLINVNYDKIIQLRDSNYYELFNGENCDIINLSDRSIVLSDCKIIKNIGYSVIYEKHGMKGIFYTLKDNKFLLLNGYDDIEYLGYSYYLVTQNGKKGILYGTETIIEPKYESIEINGYCEYRNLGVLGYSKTLYFALKKSDGNYDLAKYKKGKYSSDENKLEFLNGQGFNDIKLYDSIMVFRDNNNAYVYSYEEKLLKTYPATVDITTTAVKSGKEEIDLYIVDGIYYLYRNGNFEIAPIEDCKLYVTAYESDYGTVVINSYNKQTHDEICKQIEEGGEENLDNTLISIYGKNPKIQENYPTLIKRLKPSEKK